MKTKVFLSYPREINQKQKEFICALKERLKNNNLDPMTLGVNFYNNEAPLIGIRQLMMECNGILTVALRRTKIKEGYSKKFDNKKDKYFSEKWFTSPYCQIETAMAFQLGFPTLIISEKGVIKEGVLEQGVTGLYIPKGINMNEGKEYIASGEFNKLLDEWTRQVKNIFNKKTLPPYSDLQ